MWKEMNELKPMVKKLKKAFPEKLDHIDPDRILYASISKKKCSYMGRMNVVPERFAIFLKDHEYLLEIHKEAWDGADEGTRLYIVLHELFHITSGGFDKNSKDYKKLVKHDLEDFKSLVKDYGVNMEKTDKLLEFVNNNKSSAVMPPQ